MRFKTLDEWLAWLGQEMPRPGSPDLGLARAHQVLQALALPQPLPFTLTVAGTNGKGSSVALLDAMLRAGGYRVGCYTSPHLLRYNERIRVDGVPACDADICAAFARIDQARGDIRLSYFEFATLAALDLFSRASLDVQILEVGLGGRLDTVNVIDPDAALIASIDIDHRDWLGNTREAIALEKAGILRPGRPAVVGDPAPPDSLLRFAAERGIQLSRQGVDFGQRCDGETWDWFGQGGALERLPLPALPGAHQLLNAAAAIQLLRLAAPRRPVGEAAIRTGLQAVKLAGRFQYFDAPVPTLLDVAHNPQAAATLAAHLRTRFPGKPVRAVFAIMRDKDIGGVLAPLQPLVDHWYLAPVGLARAASAPELKAVFERLSIRNVSTGFERAQDAFAAARQDLPPDGLVLVFGTFPLVSEFLALNP